MTSPTREVICPGCGRRRVLSDRNARRNPQNCNLCRHPDKVKPPDDSDRRFWLKQFSDKEILDIALGIFDQEGSLESVREWRENLLPGVSAPAL
jgi:hypothetical protein